MLTPLVATLTKNRGVGGVMVNQISDKGICPEEHRDEGPLFTLDEGCLSLPPRPCRSHLLLPGWFPSHRTSITGHGARPTLTSSLTSLLPYFFTSRGAPRAACYTVPPMARQRLGQHFLADLHWREEIARVIRVSPHSTVPFPRDDQHCWIEIGSGHGEMSQHLLATGAPVHAIEIDPKFIAGLSHLAKQFPNFNVVPGDILKADLAAIAAGRRIRIYGNLPYFITSPILHHLFTFADLIDEIHIVIQTEVAFRVAAQPGTRDYGYLSVVTQYYTRPEFVFEIPRDAFAPPPEVTSALVTLRLPGERAKLSLSNASRFLDFVKLCFSKKRKTLVNNLRTLAKPDAAREALASLNLRPDARAEQLPVAQFAALQALLGGS
jgi:16S rRNA (adenine1518-N6/adenine1519-N6)-dimethyltransferase